MQSGHSHHGTKQFSEYITFEITKRLYRRSNQSQRQGQQRREEIDRVRALSNLRAPTRISKAPPSSHPPQVLPLTLSVASVTSFESRSPAEVSSCLYKRSEKL